MKNTNLFAVLMLFGFVTTHTFNDAPRYYNTPYIDTRDLEKLIDKRTDIKKQIDLMKDKATSLKNRIASLQDKSPNLDLKTRTTIVLMKGEVLSLENKLTSVENKTLKNQKKSAALGALLLSSVLTCFEIPKIKANVDKGSSYIWQITTTLPYTLLYAVLGACTGALIASDKQVKKGYLAQDINRKLLSVLNILEGRNIHLTPEQIESSTIRF